MFIEIEESIIQDLEAEGPMSQKLMVVEELFNAMLIGKHIVFMSRNNLGKIVDNMLFSARVREYVTWIKNNFMNIYSCRDSIKSKVVVTNVVSKIEYSEDNKETVIIKLPFNYFMSVNESKLLTEHESDAKFFYNIANYILNKRNTSGYFKLAFENDSYHGSNGGAKIKQVEAAHRLALCIVDSDRPYSGGKRGCTFRGVNDAYKKAKKKTAIELFELQVREKENLLPASIYVEFTDNKLVKILNDHFMQDKEIISFFDIKEGVKYKRILQDDKNWHSHYDDIIKKCEKSGICNMSLSEEDVDEYYINGIGDNLADRVIDGLFSNDNDEIKNQLAGLSVEQIDNIKNNREEILNRLPKWLIEYWTEISDSVFSWGCCISRDKYPRIRNWDLL